LQLLHNPFTKQAQPLKRFDQKNSEFHNPLNIEP
jgi:hypothetical protein